MTNDQFNTKYKNFIEEVFGDQGLEFNILEEPVWWRLAENGYIQYTKVINTFQNWPEPRIIYQEVLQTYYNKVTQINQIQENETINVPTTVARVTTGQRFIGSSIPGRTSKASITVGHLSNRTISA